MSRYCTNSISELGWKLPDGISDICNMTITTQSTRERLWKTGTTEITTMQFSTYYASISDTQMMLPPAIRYSDSAQLSDTTIINDTTWMLNSVTCWEEENQLTTICIQAWGKLCEKWHMRGYQKMIGGFGGRLLGGSQFKLNFRNRCRISTSVHVCSCHRTWELCSTFRDSWSIKLMKSLGWMWGFTGMWDVTFPGRS